MSDPVWVRLTEFGIDMTEGPCPPQEAGAWVLMPWERYVALAEQFVQWP